MGRSSLPHRPRLVQSFNYLAGKKRILIERDQIPTRTQFAPIYYLAGNCWDMQPFHIGGAPQLLRTKH
jgi:hypothetical protein